MRFAIAAGALVLLLAAVAAPSYSQDSSEVGIQPGSPEVAASGEQTPLEEAPATEEGAAPIPLVSTWDFVRMILVLAAVIGFIYVLFVLLRRSGKRRVAENDLIRVLGTRVLSGSRSLHLVTVGRSVYLVGSADGGVGLVSEITDKESIDTVLLEAQRQPGTTKKTFSEVLAGLFAPGGGGAIGGNGTRLALPGGGGRAGGSPLGFIRKQRERLKGL